MKSIKDKERRTRAEAEKLAREYLEESGHDFSIYPDSQLIWQWAAMHSLHDKALVPDNVENLVDKIFDGIKGGELPTSDKVREQAIAELKQEFPKPKKGLFIYGPPGTGKTDIASRISEILEIPFFDAAKVDEYYRLNPTKCVNEEYRDLFINRESTVILDDLGNESRKLNFGADPPMINILSNLWNMWEKHGKLIVITSNLTMRQNQDKSINAYYGQRIYDRLQQILVPVLFNGDSFRRQ